MRFRLITAATLAATSIAGGAAAQEQPWLQDRRLGEVIGIRAGNFELHPGVAAEAGYDSNYFLRSGSGEGEDVVSVFRFRLTPSVSLSTLGATRRDAVAPGAAPVLVLRSSLWASYNELVATDSQYSEEVSEQRHVDLGIGIAANIAPQSRIGGDVYGDYVRIAEPSSQLVTDVAFDRGSVRGGAGISYRPGGGLFEWRLGYELRVNYFEDVTYQIYDNYLNSILTRGRWRFLPRTAILYDAQYTWVRYTNRGSPVNDGEYAQARMGLSGLVTNRFAFTALMGWTSSYFVNDGNHLAQNYDGIVGQAELKWFLLPTPTGNSASVGLSSIAVGYSRDFSPSYLGSFYIRDRGYANFDYFVGGVMLFTAEGGLGRYNYPASQFRISTGSTNYGDNSAFAETRADLKLFGEYRFSNTLAINGTVLYDRRVGGDIGVTNRGSMEPATEDIDYSRWQAWIGGRWFM
jgi:hypothetical protein